MLTGELKLNAAQRPINNFVARFLSALYRSDLKLPTAKLDDTQGVNYPVPHLVLCVMLRLFKTARSRLSQWPTLIKYTSKERDGNRLRDDMMRGMDCQYKSWVDGSSL
jgi:hypothetical protein